MTLDALSARQIVEVFGEPVTVRNPGAAPVTLAAVWDPEAHAAFDAKDGNVQTARLEFFFAAADFAYRNAPGAGSRIVRHENGREYVVRSPARPSGTGGLYVAVHEADAGARTGFEASAL